MTGPTERANRNQCPDCGGRTDRPYLICSTCRETRREAIRTMKAARPADASGLARIRAKRAPGTPPAAAYFWSEQDDEIVAANPTMPAAKLAALLGRSINAIHARRMRLRRRG